MIEKDSSPAVAPQQVSLVTKTGALGFGIEALREVRNGESRRYNSLEQISANPTIARYDAAIATLIALREADW